MLHSLFTISTSNMVLKNSFDHPLRWFDNPSRRSRTGLTTGFVQGRLSDSRQRGLAPLPSPCFIRLLVEEPSGAKNFGGLGTKIGHSEPAGEESGVGSVWPICNTRATPPMEPAHCPRPFGCGLRVTVRSARTRTVVDPGGISSSFMTPVTTTMSYSEVSFPWEADSAPLDGTTIQKARPL